MSQHSFYSHRRKKIQVGAFCRDVALASDVADKIKVGTMSFQETRKLKIQSNGSRRCFLSFMNQNPLPLKLPQLGRAPVRSMTNIVKKNNRTLPAKVQKVTLMNAESESSR